MNGDSKVRAISTNDPRPESSRAILEEMLSDGFDHIAVIGMLRSGPLSDDFDFRIHVFGAINNADLAFMGNHLIMLSVIPRDDE